MSSESFSSRITSVRAMSTGAVALLLFLLYPGFVAGVILAGAVWAWRSSPSGSRWILAGATGALGIASGGLIPYWGYVGETIGGGLFWPFVSEMLLGPLVLMVGLKTAGLSQITSGAEGLEAPSGSKEIEQTEGEERAAKLELGSRSGGRPFEVSLPEGIALNILALGSIGTGKTTTLTRIINDCLRAGYGVVIIDAKGSGALRRDAEAMAKRMGLPFHLVDPQEPEKTLKYNPAAGEPADVANKLIGAFRFGPQAEVFKQVSQEILPVLAGALRENGDRVTLKNLSQGMNSKRIIALSSGEGPASEELASIDAASKLHEQSYAGMRARLNSLRHGSYGPVFDLEEGAEELDLEEALSSGVTYISLPAMASSEDSELMARVLIQDLKQAAASRIREGDPQRALLIMDEFAAFDEAEQVKDLLLQSREARISVALSTQMLPREPSLRKSMLSTGLLISHRVGSEDARDVAEAIGRKKKMDIGRSFSDSSEEGESYERISARPTEGYHIEPRELTELGVGKAAVALRAGEVRENAFVEVSPVENHGEEGR